MERWWHPMQVRAWLYACCLEANGGKETGSSALVLGWIRRTLLGLFLCFLWFYPTLEPPVFLKSLCYGARKVSNKGSSPRSDILIRASPEILNSLAMLWGWWSLPCPIETVLALWAQDSRASSAPPPGCVCKHATPSGLAGGGRHCQKECVRFEEERGGLKYKI